MTTRMVIKNKQTQPAAVIRVWHEGPNDYRVQIDGAGDYSKTTQLGYAIQNASWLANLNASDFGHEVLKVIDSNFERS